MKNNLEEITKDLHEKAFYAIFGDKNTKYNAAFKAFEDVYYFDNTLSSNKNPSYKWGRLECYEYGLDEVNNSDDLVAFEGCNVDEFAKNVTKQIFIVLKKAIRKYAKSYENYDGLEVLAEFEKAGGKEAFKNTLLAILTAPYKMSIFEENNTVYTVVGLMSSLTTLKAVL